MDLIKPGAIAKIEGEAGYALYKFMMVKPDNSIVCKSLDKPYPGNCHVGGLMRVTWATEDGSCTIPVKIVGLGGREDVIVFTPIGGAQEAERNEFKRVKPASGVHLKLQFEGSISRYNSISVYGISANSVSASVFSRSSIEAGQPLRVEIDLYSLQSRIVARGVISNSVMSDTNSNEYILDIEFVDIAQLDQQKLEEFVAWEIRTQAERAEHQRQKEKEEQEREKQRLKKQKEKDRERKKREKEYKKKEQHTESVESKEGKKSKTGEPKTKKQPEKQPDKDTGENPKDKIAS
ncbi:MAG: hypothetical protein K6T91_07960 [Firmicutes bacterium]|nr:hypothetical protein [Bacillota bacterium]